MKLMLERSSGSGKKKGGRAGKQKQLGRGNDEYLEETTPVEIIGERRQRLRMSRMDTQLQTPVKEEKGGRVGKKTTED